MKLQPNTNYYKIFLVVYQQGIWVSFPGYSNYFYLNEELEVPEFLLSEEQYTRRYLKCVEKNIEAALRKYIEFYFLGCEHADFDDNGDVIDETWKWVPGYIAPSTFSMKSLPRYSKKVEKYVTDGDGNLRRRED